MDVQDRSQAHSSKSVWLNRFAEDERNGEMMLKEVASSVTGAAADSCA